MSNPISFERFSDAIVARLRAVDFPVSEATPLFDVGVVDSLELLRLHIVIDELSGCQLPDLDPPSLSTFGDAYGYYCSQVQRAL